MSVRRSTAAAVVSTLALTTLAVAGMSSTTAVAAPDDTPGYSLRHIHVDTLVGPDKDQPCTISADIYKPDGATARSKAPAILTTHGFGGSKDDDRQAPIGEGFVKEGYVVLSYSGLGFGGSECKIHLDDPDWDGKAGKQMVDVLAGKKDFTDDATARTDRLDYVAKESPGDPRVGMIGGSYGGQLQYAVAMQDKRVDALIPLITWNDLSYSLSPNNTDVGSGVTYSTPGVHKRQWTDLFFAAGILDGIDDPQVDPARNIGCPNFTDEACPAAAQLHAQGYASESTLALSRHASVASYSSRIKAPTLIVQGQADTLFNLDEAVATYRALRANGTEARMVWQSWGHSDLSPEPGELDFGAESLRDSYLGKRFLNWMNRHVRGNGNAPAGPRFEFFRDWVDYDTSKGNAGEAIAKSYVGRSSFSQKPTASLFFSGTDTLTAKAAKVATGSASYANTGPAPTSYSETSGVEGSEVDNPVSDTEGTFVAYTSPRLARSTALVGSASLELNLEAPVAAGAQSGGPDGKLILFAKVYDVAPDGTPTLQHRLISPVRVADVTKPVSVRLPAVVHQFKRGHRIQVVIAASDTAYANNVAAQPVTVTTSKTEPSVLRLPLTNDLRF